MEENYLVVFMFTCGVLGQIYFTYYFFKNFKNNKIKNIDLTLLLIGGGLAIGATSVLFVPVLFIYSVTRIVEKFRL